MKIVEFILKYWDSIVAILVAIATAITSVVVAIKNKQWNKLKDFVQDCIKTAETLSHYTGAEKKEYVMTKANQFAITKSIKFNADKVSSLVEDLVALTKQVNQREKDKQNKGA